MAEPVTSAGPEDFAETPWSSLRPLLTEVPPATLNPYLDAAAAVLQRQGFSKTTIPDIARELRVSRTTVYRQLRSVDDAARLLAAREVHRLVSTLPRRIAGKDGARQVALAIGAAVTFASEHPVIRKLIRDEPEVIGPAIIGAHRLLVESLRPVIEPLLHSAMAAGSLASRDPGMITDWLVRIGTSLVLHPTDHPIVPFVEELVLPLLSTEPRPS